MKPENSTFYLVLAALLAVSLGWFVQKQFSQTDDPSLLNTEFDSLLILPNRKPISAFNFTTHEGKPFTSDDFGGQWSILFFGFTHCPDICPATLQILREVKAELQKQDLWQGLTVYMVTVDPQRDTVEKLANYVPYFDNQFIGLTADLATLKAFAAELGVVFGANPADESGRYEVDHSAALILLDENSQRAGVAPAPHQVASLSRDLGTLVNAAQLEDLRKELNNDTPDIPDGDAISVSQAWIRLGPPDADLYAAYFVMHNHSGKTLSLVGVSSPLFDEISLHNTQVENGIARMLPIDAVQLAANARVDFMPMGKHLMLEDAAQTLIEKQRVPLLFHFANGEKLEVEFVVSPTPLSQ